MRLTAPLERRASMVASAPLAGTTLTAAAAERAGAGAGARVVATGIGKAYGPHRVLRELDLALAASSLVAVAGTNGVGKSTLLACLAGIARHDGRVLLDGQPVGRATRKRIAYLPQRLRLPAGATGREVGRLLRALDGRPDRVLLPQGFLPALDRPVGQLSGGQAQRVALASVLQGAPDLILLDEPFANLDDEGREQAHDILRAHRDAGATVLVASPTALDLLAVIDRVVVIEEGRIGFDGAPSRDAGRLEITVRVRSGAIGPHDPAALPDVLRTRREREWVALDCRGERAIRLLRALETLGVPAEDVRLGGPLADGRVSPAPGGGGRGGGT